MAHHDRHQVCGVGIGFRLQAACLALLAVMILACWPSFASAQTPIPSTRIGTAALVAPSAADGYYDGLPSTSTNGLGLTQRPDEIRELARALRNDVDLIYDYVRNNVEIEWAYGLRKGALGALIDRSGTAFDQAQLMVELVREAALNGPVAYTASYQVGTITLTPALFKAWSGTDSALSACQLLSSGAIPAIIEGATSATCSYGAGAMSQSITLAHIWVSITIPGSGTYVFDPAYKAHAYLTGLDLYSATTLQPGQTLTSALTGSESGAAQGGVQFVRDLNAESIANTLQSYGSNLLNRINLEAPSGAIEDVVGGQRIVRSETPTNGLRQATLPYPVVPHGSPWPGGVPDKYRTTLRVSVVKQNNDQTTPTIFDRTLFVDEIYGRKLGIAANFDPVAPNNIATNTFTLRLTGRTGADVTPAPLGTYSVNEPLRARNATVTLAVNHPYAAAANGLAAASGNYMDDSINRTVFMLLPFTIMHGWGDTNGLSEAWGHRDDITILPTIPPACDTCPDSDLLQSAGDARREQIAASWMTQASRAARMHAQIAHAIYTHHHSLGVVAADGSATHQTYGDSAHPTYYYTIADSFDRIDVDDAFSVTSTSANASDRRAAVLAIAATRDALEGSVAGEIADLPDTTSTATRFEWGNRPPSSEDSLSNNYGPRRFYQFNAGNAGQALALAVAEGQATTTVTATTHGCGGEPPLNSGALSGWRTRVSNAVNLYATAGFDVVASEEGFLGPGQRAGSFHKGQGIPAGACAHFTSQQRGGALVAVRWVDGEPVQIAHIAINDGENAKGGGGGAQADHQARYDPATAADVLRARFVDRSNAVGVDLSNGAVTYASPAELSVGNGAFPYRLSANLIWRLGPEILPPAHLTTNWHNEASVSGSALQAMGESDARAAAGTVAAFLAQQDIYRGAASVQREAAALLVSAWWLRQVSGNVVTVNVGTDTRQFVRNVNGAWFTPGAASYATLAQTGARVAGTYQDVNCASGSIDYIPTRGWLYDGVSFEVTNSGGDKQSFVHWRASINNSSGVGCAAQLRGFRMSSWSFPQGGAISPGVTINLTYAQLDGYAGPVITEIRNTLGRLIRYSYAGTMDQFAWTGFDNGLPGADARAVTRASCGLLTCVTDAAGAQTRINLTPADGNLQLEVFDDDDTTIPSLRYTFDTLGRVSEARDAVALQGTQSPPRAPYLFRIAPGARGEREDPLGGRYTMLSNIFDATGARSSRVIDELGRTTNTFFDGRGRATRYVYPELDEERLAYDARNRVTAMTRLAKPGSGLANIVVAATWNDTWNKPATITDARGCVTNLTYVASGLGAGQIATATRPAATGAAPCTTGTRPVYSFTYGAFGQVASATDPTGVVVSNVYNPTNGTLTSSTLDPGVAPHANAVTSFTYNPLGDVIASTDPRGNVTETSYDLMRRPLAVLHHNGGLAAALLAAERTTYDVLGRVTATEGGTAFSGTSVTTWLTRESRTYTPTGQVATVTNGAGNMTRTCYDGLDRAKIAVDGVGRARQTLFDAAGQATEVQGWWSASLADATCALTSTLPPGQTTRHLEQRQYTLNGQVDFVDDANNNRSNYTYDGFDRLSRLEFPSPSTIEIANAADYESYTYDPNGNRLSVRRRSNDTIAYHYDNLNRECFKDWPSLVSDPTTCWTSVAGASANDVFYEYDLAGRRKSVRFASTSGQGIVYGYDTAGRMSSEVSYGRTLSFGYDLASNRERVTFPDNNFVQYTFDAMNRVDQVRLNNLTSGANLVADYGYDELSRRSSLARGAGNVAASSYGYDPASRLATLAHDLLNTSADQTWTFDYTAASQVWHRTAANDNYRWVGATIANRAYARNGLNQYTNVGGANFSYDARGNLTSDGSRTFAYDLENHLTSVNGAAFQLSYDPLGRLRQSVAGAATTEFLYDGDRLVAEYNGAGVLQRRYVHGPGVDEPLLWIEGASMSAGQRWLAADAQGSVVAATDASGALIGAPYAYGPYGEPDSVNLWSGSRFRYTGQIALPEAGLYHYKARVYDPVLGRFLQTDPVGYEDDLNLYAYVRNDPLNMSDPTGRCPPGNVACAAGWHSQIADATTNVVARLLGAVANLAADLTPGVGDVKGGLEFAQDPSLGGALGVAAGLAPGGDAARPAIREGVDAAVDGVSRTFHRLESPTQSPEVARMQESSGEIWGRTPRGGDVPTVQAYEGPLPGGARGVEFTTDTPPSSTNFLSGEARWREGSPGVESRTHNGDDFAVIQCTVTRNTQC